MSRPVLFRARSGPDVGMGHVMRSRSIAQEVLERGGRPIVVVDDDDTQRALESDPFEVVTVDARPDWASTPATGAWVDGFVDWTADLATLSRVGTASFLAENRGRSRELCDRVVYPALHYTPDDWDLEHGERVLAGAPWIPLAREIRGVRSSVERDVDLLITFGGCDPKLLTERVLSVLDLSAARIVVATGPHMAHRREELLEIVEGAADVQVLLPGMPLARWMARSRAAITAVGTTLYELAYLGVPSLIVANYEDDRAALEWYAENGPHLPLGIASELSHEGLRAALRSGLAQLETQPMALVPGLGEGASRLADALVRAVA